MDDDPHEDWHCMERLRNGDDLGLNDLMSRWKGPLVSFCLRYTGNFTDAVEIAQETFVNIYKERKRYRQQAAFSTWMFAIASNLCRMRSRWRSRHPEVLEAEQDREPALSDAAAERSNPGEEADRNALAEDLERAVQCLPHDLRVAFVLYEIEGRPYREIAGVVGCSEKAVERRLARAREQLRSILEPKWRE